MERILRIFDSQADADNAARADDNGLSYEERFDNFMELMAPYYAVAPGFQRIYRVDDFRQPTVCDDWGDTRTTSIATREQRVTSSE